MPIPSRTLDQVTSRVLGYFRTSFEGLPLGTKRFLGRVSRAVGLSLWGAQKAVEDVDNDIVPAPTNSNDALTAWMSLFGLPDGQGGVGRRLFVPASGGVASITGVNATAFLVNATATASDGSTQLELATAVTIPGSSPGYGSVTANFNAVTPGSVGNLPAGTIMTWDAPPSGADATFTLTSALSGGLDLESNPDGYNRLLSRVQTPPRGGVAEDVREWEESVKDIVAAYVYPLRSGLGTFDVVIVGGGSGQARVPSAETLDEAQAELDENVPPGSQAGKALLPYAPDGRGHAVKVIVDPSQKKYEFDWDDDVGATVSVWTGGGSPTLKLSTIAAVSLKAAIDAFNASAGDAPRLQVISTGMVATGVTYNPPIVATAWVDGGGQTTLTLATLPPGFVAPTAGDPVTSYGPLVAPIAAAIQAACDSLGPSRASGFGDPLTSWQDQLTISAINTAAATIVDVDGTLMVDKVTAGGVTIDGAAFDVEGIDSSLGPELLYLKSITVLDGSA